MNKKVDVADLYKIHDVLYNAYDHHKHRDISNTKLHLAAEVRISPLTSELEAQLNRVKDIIQHGEDI